MSSTSKHSLPYHLNTTLCDLFFNFSSDVSCLTLTYALLFRHFLSSMRTRSTSVISSSSDYLLLIDSFLCFLTLMLLLFCAISNF